MNAYVCRHSQLKRSCEICERDDEIARLRAEIEALRKGEFICQRCGLRKDADNNDPITF